MAWVPGDPQGVRILFPPPRPIPAGYFGPLIPARPRPQRVEKKEPSPPIDVEGKEPSE